MRALIKKITFAPFAVKPLDDVAILFEIRFIEHRFARYLLAVLPACHRLQLGQLSKALHRDLGLATETEVATTFGDCALGAIPPAGVLYDLDTIVDEALLEQDDIYFEAGDHERLIHMNRGDFAKLLGDARRARFSLPD